MPSCAPTVLQNCCSLAFLADLAMHHLLSPSSDFPSKSGCHQKNLPTIRDLIEIKDLLHNGYLIDKFFGLQTTLKLRYVTFEPHFTYASVLGNYEMFPPYSTPNKEIYGFSLHAILVTLLNKTHIWLTATPTSNNCGGELISKCIKSITKFLKSISKLMELLLHSLQTCCWLLITCYLITFIHIANCCMSLSTFSVVSR